MSEKKPVDFQGERRAEERGDAKSECHAVVRVSGIPVQQFRLKDISQNGTCFLVAVDSVVLRNLAVGQEIEIQFRLDATGQPTVFHRSEITHITKAPTGPYEGHCLVGVRILSRLKIS
ncbi:MAG: PilZ domain-containing protein [Desulfobacterales bacterium]